MITITPYEVLKEKIFINHSISDTKSDLEKIFIVYMGSDEAESSIDRQSSIISYLQIKKLLESL